MDYTYNEFSPHCYDKASWHYGADDFPSQASEHQAMVHTGFFVGWLAEKGFLAVNDHSEELISQFQNREITGPELYSRMGEALVDYMINEEGNCFAQHYFDFQNGEYMDDYSELLVKELPSEYLVPDTWENYEIIASRINERYESWQREVSA